MFLKYIGPHAEVQVDALNNVIVQHASVIEVTPEQAEGLLVQEDNWKKTSKSATAAEEKE